MPRLAFEQAPLRARSRLRLRTRGDLGNMIIGLPTLAQWGVALDSDADGNIWVELRKLGITMLAERFGVPSKGSV